MPDETVFYFWLWMCCISGSLTLLHMLFGAWSAFGVLLIGTMVFHYARKFMFLWVFILISHNIQLVPMTIDVIKEKVNGNKDKHF
jgi:hypothetical protein